MAIISRGYELDESAADSSDREWQLFSQNIDLILKHEQDILACGDYFFCSLAFAYSSWTYVAGDGQLFLGYLLLGWRNNILIEQCPVCTSGKVSITSFGGSPLSGSNGWTGICLDCHQKQQGKHSEHFRQWMDFVLSLRKSFPEKVSEEQEYDSQEFTFGGNGLKPVRKKKTIWKSVAEPVPIASLIDELKSGSIRKGKPPNVQLLKKDLKLKLSNSAKSLTILRF
jgi:hypothetical protein